MITKLAIKNFQSHKDNLISFCPGVNVIIGDSDSGKSGTVRALKSVLFRDNFYVSHWSADGSVEVVFDDYVLKRTVKVTTPTKCPNCKEEIKASICKCGEVIGNKPSEDSYLENGVNKFEKFGTSVPDFINKNTRMFPIKFVDFEERLSVLEQFDDIFFVGKTYSGGIRNKIMSAFVPDSEKIDFSVKECASRIAEKRAEIKITEEKIVGYEKCVIDGEEIATALDAASKEHETKSESVRRIKNMSDEIGEIVSKVSDPTKIQTLKEKIDKIQPYLVKMWTLLKSIEQINLKMVALDDAKSKIVDLPDLVIKTFDWKSMVDRIMNIDSSVKSLHDLKTDNLIITVGIDKTDKESMELALEIQKLKEELNSKDMICPVIKGEFQHKCKELLGL